MSDPHGNDELNSRINEIHARQTIMEANILGRLDQVATQGEMISQIILDALNLAQRIDRVELKLKQQQQNGFSKDGPMG